MRHCFSRRFQSRSLTNTTNPPLNYRGYSFTRTKLNIFFRPYFQERELGRRLRPQEAARVRGPRRRARLPCAQGHREGQHRQQERRELRVHPEEPLVPRAGKCSTVPSLISICASLLQFAASVEHSEKCTFQLNLHFNIQFWGLQNEFQMGNDSSPHLRSNLYFNLGIKMPKRKSRSKMGLLNTLQATTRLHSRSRR